MSLCGTNDLKRNYPDYGTLMGTYDAAGTFYPGAETDFFIGEAEQWFLARLNDFEMAPPMPDPAAGTYDYYVRDAVANRAIFMCADGYLRRETELTADGTTWWDTHRDRADAILQHLREGDYRLSYQTSMWEHGIGPAMPVANGTVSAPAAGICRSNHGYTGVAYTGDTARTCIVELDGTSGTVQDQTFRWKWADSSDDWEAEQIECSPSYWNAIGYGLKVFFNNPETGTLESGMRWEIPLNPIDEAVPTGGITVCERTYG